MTTNMIELLTVHEAAEALRSTPQTIRRMLADGRLRGVRLGGPKLGWRIESCELAAFIARSKATPATMAHGSH